MGCMALRTLPNRLSADPVKPAVHLIRNSLAFDNWKERKRLWKILSKAVRFFFFRAEDGIRDDLGTGVQTCALPIWAAGFRWPAPVQAAAQARTRVQSNADAERSSPLHRCTHRHTAEGRYRACAARL